MPYILSLIAPHGEGRLDTSILARIAARHGQPRILAPGDAAEFACDTPPDLASLDIDPAAGIDPTAGIVPIAGVDIVITPAANRRKRLLIADMDSTIVTGETLDELAVFAGVGDQVAAITRRSMNGEIDFAAALRERVALLRGLLLDALDRTWAGVRLTPGAITLVRTMRAHGAHAALVSVGFTWFTAKVSEVCGFDTHRANTLLDDGTTLLGTVSDPILDRGAKLSALHELTTARGLSPADALAVGDGANDLDMIRAAGLGIAYHAKPIVAAEARVRIVHSDLRALLYIQGYAADEFAPDA